MERKLSIPGDERRIPATPFEIFQKLRFVERDGTAFLPPNVALTGLRWLGLNPSRKDLNEALTMLHQRSGRIDWETFENLSQLFE